MSHDLPADAPIFAQPILGPHWGWLAPLPAQPKRALTEEDRAVHRAIAVSERAMSPALR